MNPDLKMRHKSLVCIKVAIKGRDKTDFNTHADKLHSLHAQAPGPAPTQTPCRALTTPLPIPLTCTSQWQVSPMKGKPIDPLGMGSLQFLSRVAVHRSCHSCWETARSRAMDTRQAARVARAETRSKLSNNMMMKSTVVSLKYRKVWKVRRKVFTL